MGFHFVVSIYFRTTSLYLTISQQITQHQLFQIPQRYRFSSKSQRAGLGSGFSNVVLDTTKVQIFKQITTPSRTLAISACCFRYHKGTDFQANHNRSPLLISTHQVVLDTTKVQIFKQITTHLEKVRYREALFQIPQRYRFSSKSQQFSTK